MKRAVSWILVAAIMLGFVGMIAFSVFAESYITEVYIDTPDFQVGDTIPTEFEVGIDGGTLVEIGQWRDDDGAPVTGTFEAGKVYWVSLELQAPEGQYYSRNDITLIINGYNNYGYLHMAQDEGTWMAANIEFDFRPEQAEWGSLRNLPEGVEAGPVVAPEGMQIEGQVVITDTCWVDADKNPVTVMEDGKRYYLEVTLAPIEGCEFRYNLTVYGDDIYADDTQIVSTTEAKAWFLYSLEPGVGRITLTYTGIEPGAPITGVEAVLPEDSPVQVDEIYVADADSGDVLESGNFEKGRRYDITFMVEAKEGYNLADYEDVTIEGADSWGYHLWNGYLQVSFTYSTCEPIGTVVLTSSGLEVGKAMEDVQLQIHQGAVSVENIAVLDWETEEELSGSFEKGKNYMIRYALVLEDGYSTDGDYEIILNGGGDYGWNGDTYRIWVWEKFSTCETVDTVKLAMDTVKLGDKIADAVVTAESDAYTVEYQWLNGDTDEEVSGTFGDEHTYLMHAVVYPAEGNIFAREPAVLVGDYTEDDYYYDLWNGGEELHIYLYVDLRPERLGWCHLEGAPYEIAPGKATVPTLQPINEFTVTNVRWVDADKKKVTTFKDGKLYYLEVTLAPEEGYEFRDWLYVNDLNYAYAWETQIVSSTEAKAWFRYSLMPGVGEVDLTVTGVAVGSSVSGVKATVPSSAKVTVAGIKIYDLFRDEYVESGSFQDNRRYNITYALNAKSGYDIEKMEGVTINGEYAYDWGIEDGVAYVNQVFSTCEPVGEVRMTSSGLGVGKPFAGVELQVPADAGIVLDRIEVYDCASGEIVTDGSFAEKSNYWIHYYFQVKEGYSPEDGIEIILNGEQPGCSYNNETVEVSEFFSTCTPIRELRLTLTEPSVGTKVENAKLTAPEDLCSVEYSWWDVTTDQQATGTFQKGHAYVLDVNMNAAEGYRFDEDTVFLINGQRVNYSHIGENGNYGYLTARRSFLEKITKVELPQLPTKLSKGNKLSTDLKAPTGAGYTLEAEWGLLPEGETVTKVSGNGSYVLYVNVVPQEGYEFAEDVVVTENGKEFTGSVLHYSDSLGIYKTYNVGMKVIDTIEITVETPRPGGIPTEPTFSAGIVPYGYQWLYSTTDSTDNAEVTEVFRADAYNYLYFMLLAEDGYAFADQVTLLVNGQPMEAILDLNLGCVRETVVSFGRLREPGCVGRGDLDGLAGIDEEDAVYLLKHLLFPELYPVGDQDVDFDADGDVDEDDVVYLLQYLLFPEEFPLTAEVDLSGAAL